MFRTHFYFIQNCMDINVGQFLKNHLFRIRDLHTKMGDSQMCKYMCAYERRAALTTNKILP